jgi:TonB-dependent receptor
VKRSLLTGILVLMLGLMVSGQSKFIKISGRVYDAASGSPLLGASVLVEGSKAGVKSDVEGNFFISLEEGKTYNLLISNIGFQTKQISGIKPSSIENQPVDVSLERSIATLENVVVRSNSRRESISSVYLAQKNSAAISDGISAESIKRSPDRNTGEVLKRVSGTSVQDNKFVIVRGLNERYNTSLLNNSVLPSTEPDKKAFSFDIIPASLVDNVTIFKSPTPDLPGDFAGGAVKVTTKDYPSKYLSELTFVVGYNSLSTFKPFYKQDPPGKFDALGYFDNSRLMPGGYYHNSGAEFINLTDPQKLEITKQFPNNFAYQQACPSQPNFSISYTGGNTKVLSNGNKLGYIYTLGYTAGRRVINRYRQEYETYGLLDYFYNTTNYDTRTITSALINLSYSYRKSKIALKTLFNNDFAKTVALRSGTNQVNPNSPFSYSSSSTEGNANGIGSAVLEGLHSLDRTWTIDWNASYSIAWRWQPDQTILAFHTDPNSQNYYLSLSNQNSPDILNAGRVYSYLVENIYGANVNATKLFNWHGQPQRLKFGTANYYRNRNVDVYALGYASLLAGFGTIHVPETKDINANTIFTPTYIDQYQMVVANIGTNSTSYTGTALLNAGYVMLDNKFSDKVRLTWGLRLENYDQELKAAGKPDIILKNLDLLPSFVLTYSLNNKTNLRAAASQSVNRPEFRELATYRQYDYENQFIIQGNDLLTRSKNTNADLRYEFFPAAGEIISASVFYKYFDQPIEQTNQGNDVLSYANAKNANVYGVEAEFRKNLGFIKGNFFNNLVLYANAALMKGSVVFDTLSYNIPMQGQSPYLINGGLNYSMDDNSLSFNLLYNIIGPRLKFRAIGGAGKNIFEQPRNVLDFQVSKRMMNNKLEVKLTISDILAESYTWYYKYQADPTKLAYNPSQDRIVNSYKLGTTVYFALRYNF